MGLPLLRKGAKTIDSYLVWSTHGMALRANVQCAKVNQFYFAFASISSFYPSLLFTCSALLCLTFILPLISSLHCFYKFLIYFSFFNYLV